MLPPIVDSTTSIVPSVYPDPPPPPENSPPPKPPEAPLPPRPPVFTFSPAVWVIVYPSLNPLLIRALLVTSVPSDNLNLETPIS